MRFLTALFSLVSLLAFNNPIVAQTVMKFDTISTYDVNLSSSMTTNGRIYFANGKAISKAKYEFYKSNWERVQRCQPCEVSTYNENHELKHIAIQYGDCFVGPFKEFYTNGKVKVEGNFKSITNNDWSSLRLRGLCSTREGEWKHYSPEGKLETIEQYEHGKVVHVEKVNENSDNENSNLRSRFKRLFKKDSE
ncbi:MAG TPA: hypothetical protein VFD65_05790 [Chitinophagales bacterium]|nr:hypothetical protein [Chitinophagales bacterium]